MNFRSLYLPFLPNPHRFSRIIMSNYNQSPNLPNNPNQSLDYESWVNSLGNMQDGIFQNTPISNHIIQTVGASNQANIMSNTPTSGGHGLSNIPNLSNPHDINMDVLFNSPERFYRDIINESPVINRTPLGRTPLRNLSLNFSTPNFLKNIETTKSVTPLKNQLFNSNEMFQTPNNHPQNSTLNSSPTTIKINSSAVKEDDHNKNHNIPASPTPASKISPYDPAIPKMGYFKQSSPKQVVTTSIPKKKPQQSKFQIIMTDVNSFANNSKGTKKKKRLTRSSTQPSIKKTSLKRSLSQPSKNMQNTELVQDLFDDSLRQGEENYDPGRE